MAEYITKEQALGAILETLELTGKEWAEIYFKIKNIPAADADIVPVVHGHWKFSGEDGHGYGLWRCTYCGNVVHEKAAKWFCPECGARMDGGESNG